MFHARITDSRDFTVIWGRAVLIDVPDDVLIARSAGRRVDPATGAIYNLTTAPPANDAALRARLTTRKHLG